MWYSIRYSVFNNQSTVWSRFGLHPRKLFSSSNRISGDNRRRTDDPVDRKIFELSQQGLTAARIARELPGHSYNNINYRLNKLRGKLATASPSTGKHWKPDEDAVLLEKREAGAEYREILPFLPGRSINAARNRHVALKQLQGDAGPAPRHNNGRPWSPEERQRVMDMVLVDGLPFKDIAQIMGRSCDSIQLVWQKDGRKALPANTLKKFRGAGDWTAIEDNILVEQLEKGFRYKDIQLKIPGRNRTSLSNRARALGIARLNISATEVAAIRRELQAVLNGNATYEEVASKFSSTSAPSSVKNIWYRMRTGYYKK